ncbi:MAG TPA: hypothetical protein VFL57_04470 [Bryobacteraceae bacterium]|nr:hypothetical protein [Bryobacteraceae bacterium]
MDTQPREADRILFLTLPDAALLRRTAERVTRGLVVGIGPDDAVRAARRAIADLDNVMLIPAGEPGDPIPWQDGFFTTVIAPHHREVEPEMLRVTAPGGAIHLADRTIERPR